MAELQMAWGIERLEEIKSTRLIMILEGLKATEQYLALPPQERQMQPEADPDFVAASAAYEELIHVPAQRSASS